MIRFLDEHHSGRYKVYNLCIERGYDSGMFGGRVMRLPLYDGQVGTRARTAGVANDATAHYRATPIRRMRRLASRVLLMRRPTLPIPGPQAPPLHLVTCFLHDAVTWLAECADHVVAVHCKAGKGRTGALVCALLLALVRRSGVGPLGRQGGQSSRTEAITHMAHGHSHGA